MPAMLCALNENGIPLYTRTCGLGQPAFPALGLLSALFSSAEQNGYHVHALESSQAKIVFKRYDSVLLALVTSRTAARDAELFRVLDFLYHGMVLLLGIQEMKQALQVERLRRLMRTTNNLVDILVGDDTPLALLTQCVEIISTTQATALGYLVNAFAKANSTSYACIYIKSKACVATSDWWDLDNRELVLMTLLLQSLSPATCRDIPVYLPITSPDVPYRFLSFTVTHGVEVVILTGPEADLEDIEENQIEDYFLSGLPTIMRALDSVPRNLSPHIAFDRGVLGFIAVHRELGKVLACYSPAQPDNAKPGGGHGQQYEPAAPLPDTMRTSVGAGGIAPDNGQHIALSSRPGLLTAFYRAVSPPLYGDKCHTPGLYPVYAPLEDDEKGQDGAVSQSGSTEAVGQSYMKSADYGMASVIRAPHEIYVLFSNDVPQYAYNGLCLETIGILERERVFGAETHKHKAP